jgi:hypothetical protein
MTRGLDLIKRRYPDGKAMLAEILREALDEADKQSHPVEVWTKILLDFIGAKIPETFKSLRDGHNGDRSILKARSIGSTMSDAEIVATAKQIRKHLKVIEPQATQMFSVLKKRITNPKTRELTLTKLSAWIRAANNPNVPAAVAGRALSDVLTDDQSGVPSDAVTRGLLEAIETADFINEQGKWPTKKDTTYKGKIEWKYELAPQSYGEQYERLIEPEIDLKTLDAMRKYGASLSDFDSDLMLLAMAFFAGRAKSPRDQVDISIDELCEKLGYKKQRNAQGYGASYRDADKAAVRHRFEELQNGFLTIKDVRRTGNNKPVNSATRVLTIHKYEWIGQADFNGAYTEWISVKIGFGEAWAQPLFSEQGKQLAFMHARSLEYSHQKEVPEKRISKRLGWFWKLNLRRDIRTVTKTVRTLIADDIRDKDKPPEKYSRRDAERLELALDTLKRDKVIGDWGYFAGETRIDKTEGALPHGWLYRWLAREVEIDIPESLRLTYLEHQPARKQAPALPSPSAAPTGAKFGEAFREFRLARGISGLQASKEAGIHNTTLSLYENGKREPSDKHRQTMMGWMRDLENRPDKLAARYADDADGHQPGTH